MKRSETDNMPRHTNRLADESSPYLLQHAHNPVEWYPWGEEAFARARAEERPILLSVGYSACHWCHVMEHESFENEAIAALMNRDFVSIKVDREERPDVDAIYMGAVQMMTGQGGWPMTVFLTPDGRPFYGGTYFPPEDRYDRPGFPRVLEAVAEAWRHQRADIEAQGQELLKALERGDDLTRDLPDTLLTPTVLENAYRVLAAQYDRQHGGFGSAPKFPQPANLDFLLRFHARSRQQEPLGMVEQTLQCMALGGIYDQLGGGFHRYSTDRIWLAPHFEKMLYDNAQLAQTYARCYQATGRTFYRGIAEETLEYVQREMTGPEGGFYSAQDADSEGKEGQFFVWTPDQVKSILGPRDGAVFCAFYDVIEGGNWEDASILRVVMDAPEAAARFGMSVDEAAEILDGGRAKLLASREQRVRPALDDKVLTSWNGLMLAAFAECAVVFGSEPFRLAAIQCAQFLLDTMLVIEPDGKQRLLRTYRNGQAKLNGYLEDYAFLADGLLRLYEATFDAGWLDRAQRLTDIMIERFWDERDGGFYATSDDHEVLIQRPKDWDDNATPSGNSVAVEVMLKLAVITGEDAYRQRAARVLRRLGPILEKHPYGFARMLGALDLYLAAPQEIALIGDPANADTQALARAIYATYLPNKIVVGAAGPNTGRRDIPLLTDRTLRDGRPTAYVCEGYVCKEPLTDPEALHRQLTG